MNHPTHPEEQVFGGMVRGRDVPEPEADDLTIAYFMGVDHGKKIGGQQITSARTLAIVDAHHAKLNEALDAKDAEIARLIGCLTKANSNTERFEREWYLRGDEIARLTAAGPVAAWPQGEPVAWAVYAEVGGEMFAQYPPSFTLESAKDHQRMYGEGVNTEIRRLYTHTIAQPAVPVTDATNAELLDALEAARQAINSMKVEAETGAQGDEQMMLDAAEVISTEGLEADGAIRAVLAKAGRGQA